MKITTALLSLMLFSLTTHAQTQCPNKLEVDQKKYCLSVEWEFGEKREQGNYETSGNLSPFAIKKGEAPANWIYSRALVTVWAEDDKEQKSVQVQGLKVFPYMFMTNGMHHPATSSFVWDTNNTAYVLSKMALHEMDGCWTLRWSTNNSEDNNTSQPLIYILPYTNLSAEQNKKTAESCDKLTKTAAVKPDAKGSGHHHHH